MDFINLHVDGLERRRQLMEELRDRARDLSPVFEVMHTAFMREEHEEFATEGAHFEGHKWVPLSPAYARRKPQPPPPFGILVKTGRLLRSLTDATHGEHIKIIAPQHAAFGTRVPYAGFHQRGGGNLPQRQFVAARDSFRQLLRQATTVYLLKGELPQYAGPRVTI